MPKSFQIFAIRFRLLLGIYIALAVTLISVFTVGEPVPLKVLLLIGISRFIYSLAIWFLYYYCSLIRLQFKFLNFILFLVGSFVLITPLVPYNIWINQMADMFYPPWERNRLVAKDDWQYYFQFYFWKALLIGTFVYLTNYREDLIQEKQNIRLINEKLVQQNLMFQLEALRQQINPHFLFNTLNSLKLLIAINPKQAENFTIELSNVYRYLLNHNNKATVKLEEELTFLKSYLELLKIRFEENFIITISVESKYLYHYLLPLSLQILVENAIKHNVISKDKPLHIRIFIDENEKIVVENNIQVRISTEGSSQYGLYHLSEQTKLLTGKDIDIIKKDSTFSVHLPFIIPE